MWFWDGTVSCLVIQCLCVMHTLWEPLTKLPGEGSACAVTDPHAWFSLYGDSFYRTGGRNGRVGVRGNLKFTKLYDCFPVSSWRGTPSSLLFLYRVCLPLMICGVTSRGHLSSGCHFFRYMPLACDQASLTSLMLSANMWLIMTFLLGFFLVSFHFSAMEFLNVFFLLIFFLFDNLVCVFFSKNRSVFLQND